MGDRGQTSQTLSHSFISWDTPKALAAHLSIQLLVKKQQRVLLPAGYTIRASAHSTDQAQAQQGPLMYNTFDSYFITI